MQSFHSSRCSLRSRRSYSSAFNISVLRMWSASSRHVHAGCAHSPLRSNQTIITSALCRAFGLVAGSSTQLLSHRSSIYACSAGTPMSGRRTLFPAGTWRISICPTTMCHPGARCSPWSKIRGSRSGMATAKTAWPRTHACSPQCSQHWSISSGSRAKRNTRWTASVLSRVRMGTLK
jgi:hypothetical protein